MSSLRKRSSPDLLQSDGLFNLLIIVWIFPSGGQLLEWLREDLALAVPGAPNSFVQLEDRVAHFHARTLTLSLRLSFVVTHGTCKYLHRKL